MSLSNNDLRKEFLTYLNQSDLCELFYNYMISEDLSYVLEFYLACDGLKNLKSNLTNLIEIIFKHYLSNGKPLSSSKKFSLPNYMISSIKQRVMKRDFHAKFYDQAQEYVLKYMLQMCFPKFLIEQKNSSELKRQNVNSLTFNPMHRRKRSSKIQHNLAQRHPKAFFEEIKTRLLAHQTQTIDDDPFDILDLQIAKTMPDDDDDLPKYDSGVATDSSEKNYEIFHPLINVIWYPSLDSSHALLSTIPYTHNDLTFKEFRQLFKKQTSYRYFFKTVCTPDINKEEYVFRELTMDDEVVPFYDGKIFVQLDRIY